MTIHELLSALEAWAPARLAADYDNVGLLLGDADAQVTGILCSLDVTPDVLTEAEGRGCNVVVSHHPAWFGRRSTLTPSGFAGRVLYQAARRGLHLVGLHTNLDHVPWGVNRGLGERLGLTDLRVLAPTPGEAEGIGAGALGTLPEPLLPADFLAHLARQLGCATIRHTETTHTAIRQVAICGGSGSFLLDAALQAGADALVTGDITYHKFFDGEDRLMLCDVGHYESEQHVPAMIVSYLQEKFPNFALHLSAHVTNPIRTYVATR